MTILNDADAVYVGDIPAVEVYAGDLLVWPVDYSKTVYLATVDSGSGDPNYPPANALGQTPASYARLGMWPDITWMFPTVADLGIPLTATIDEIRVDLRLEVPANQSPIEVRTIYKTSANPADIVTDQSQSFGSGGSGWYSMPVSRNRPATWLQYGYGIKFVYGANAYLYMARAVLDWSY